MELLQGRQLGNVGHSFVCQLVAAFQGEAVQVCQGREMLK